MQEEVKEINVMVNGEQKFIPGLKRNFHNRLTQSQMNQSHVKMITSCKRCGSNHKINECFAYGKMCSKCNKLNNFAKCCKFNNNSYGNNSCSNNKNKKTNQVHNINCKVEVDKVVVLNLLEINGNNWLENVFINNCDVNIKIDTGAEVNILPISLCKK